MKSTKSRAFLIPSRRARAFLIAAVLAPLLAAAPGCGPALMTGLAVLLARNSSSSKPCAAPGVAVQVAIHGTVQFQDRPVDPRTGASTLSPVRGARVEILRLNCGEEVLAEGTTADDGSYAIEVATPSGSRLQVSVLAQRTDPSSPVTVRNNSRDRLVYSLESVELSLSEEARQEIPVDLEAVEDCQFELAGAFNILEATRIGFQRIASLLPPPPQPLTVLWELGDPDGTFFSLSTTDLDGDGRARDPYIQLRGGARIPGCRNTDQFDDGLIIHEFGHYVAYSYSRDDSPGGPHSLGEQVDPRLAWSEGWANFYSCMARGDSVIFDTFEDVSACSGPCSFFNFDLETKEPACSQASCCLGIGSEDAVGAILWDLFDAAGNDPGDTVQVPAAEIIQALDRLRARRFVFVGDYLQEISAIVSARSPSDALAIEDLARREDMTDSNGDVIAFPSPFPSEVRAGNEVRASATGVVQGCGFDPCKQNVESFIGSSDFFELLLPGSPGVGGRLDAQVTISGGSTSCDRNLELRIFNESQSFVFTTAGQAGTVKRIGFDLDADFSRGSYVLVELAGDTGSGQTANYSVLINVQ